MRLYEIDRELLDLEAFLEASAGETGEIDARLLDRLETAEAAAAVKLDAYAAAITTLRARAATRKAEAARMRELQRLDDAAAERLARVAQTFMDRHELQRVDGARFRLTVGKVGGVLGLAVDDTVTPADVEPRFVRVRHEFDRAAIRAAVTEGEALAWARLLPRARTLRIK